MLLDRRIISVGSRLQRVARLLASKRERHDIEPTESQPTFNSIASIQDDPGFSAIVRNAESEARQAFIEIIDLLGPRRWLQCLEAPVGEVNSTICPLFRHILGSK